jgi:hypothetical protein
METRLRMLIVLAGLPEPVVDFKGYWEDGTVRYRFDLSYPDHKIVVEYDGRQHRDDLTQWDHDVERGEWFDDDGWRGTCRCSPGGSTSDPIAPLRASAWSWSRAGTRGYRASCRKTGARTSWSGRERDRDPQRSSTCVAVATGHRLLARRSSTCTTVTRFHTGASEIPSRVTFPSERR